MSFSRANVGGWISGDVITATQINQIDVNQSRGLDGTAGGTYTPSSAIVIGGEGFSFDGALHNVLTGGLITWDNGAAATWASGSTLTAAAGSTVALSGTTNLAGANHHVTSGATLTVDNGGTFVSSATSTLTIGGTTNFGGANHHVTNGATLTVDSGGVVTAAFGSTVTISGEQFVSATGQLKVQNTGTLDCQAGSVVNLSGATTVNGTDGLTISGSGSAARVRLASQSIVRLIHAPIVGQFQAAGAGVSDWDHFGTAGHALTTRVATTSYASTEVRVPDGCVVTKIEAYIDPPAGHGAWPGGAPAVLPTLSFDKIDATGTVTNIDGVTTDTAASQAAYEAGHWLEVTVTNETINNQTHRYTATVKSEGGAGAVAGFTVHNFRVTYTITSMDPD